MVHATFVRAASRLIGFFLTDDFVAQLVSSGARFRKMCGQHFSDFLDRLDDGVTEFLVPKMRAHFIDKTLPELFAAFFVNGLIPDHGKLMPARRDENEHSVPFARLVHSHPVESFLRRDQRIGIQFSALNENANLARRFCFCLLNRLHDPVVFELAQEFLCPHVLTNLSLRRRHRSCHLRR